MQRTFYFLLALLLLSTITACGVVLRSSSDSDKIETVDEDDFYTDTTNLPTKKGSLIETGVASWYGPNFNGRLTANGETFDMNGISAAHRTLPFNTEVIVENVDNGKTVRVRINDRGPFAKDRIIDLSKGAATEIDMIGPGTANVKLYLVKGDLKNSRVRDLKVAHYTVQLGSYNDLASAEKRSSEVKGSRVEQIALNGATIFRVYYGTYTDPEKAKKDLKQLQRKGVKGFVKQIEND